MSDLEIIASIEEIIGRELTVCPPKNDVMALVQRLSYKLDEQQQVIGFNLGGLNLAEVDFLKALPNLTELCLGDNQLSDVSVLKFLPNLTRLDLCDNQLDDISQLKLLTKLKLLDLNFNQIQVLPEWLLDFKLALKSEQDYRYEGIYLKDNPFVTPPIKTVQQGKEAVRSYYQQLHAEGEDYIYEAKLIVLGEAGAGKTSLANKILDPAYQLVPELDSKSTDGIEILHHDFPYQQKSFRVNIWDFGGQEINHQTHNFFLSKRSLYFLVVDNSKEDTDFYYWLNAIKSLSDNSPLLIVNNQKGDSFRSIPQHLRVEFSNIREILDVNLSDNRGLAALCERLQHYISGLPHIGSPLPKTWVRVREQLEQDLRHHMDIKEYYQLCETNGFTDQQKQLELSQFLHDLGVCVHFQQDDLLKKTLILKPNWVTDAAYKILKNVDIKRNSGHFSKTQLKQIWQDEQYEQMHGELLALMLSFKLCYKILDSEENYIAPQLLNLNPPAYAWDNLNNLELRYEYDFMPKGMVSQLIVAMHEHIGGDKQWVWKTGVVLEKGQAQAEIIENNCQRLIRVRVTGKNTKELQNEINQHLDKINQNYSGLKVSKMVPCICLTCIHADTPHFFDYDKLRERANNGKFSIECDKPPYLQVDIGKLAFNISVLDKNETNSPTIVIYKIGGDYINVGKMGDEYNLENVNMQGSNVGKANKAKIKQSNLGNDNKIDASPHENLLKKPVFYVYMFVFIYAIAGLVSAFELRKQGMVGAEVFKEIALWPLSLVKDAVAEKK